jgi:hypothetical protein
MISELPGFFNAAMGEAIDKSNREAVEGGISIPGSKKTLPSEVKRESDNRRSGQNKGVDAGAAGAAGTSTGQNSPPKTTTSNNPNDPNSKTFINMLGELKAINKTSVTNLEVTRAIKDAQDAPGTAAATIVDTPRIEVSIEGQSTVTVTGFEAGVTRIAQGLAETFGFTTEEESRSIANEVVENIRKALLSKGIITANTK